MEKEVLLPEEGKKISQTHLTLYTLFGIGRITLYLLVPALLMVRYQNNLGDRLDGIEKFLLFVATFVFSWIIILLDYRFVLKKQKLIK